MGKSGRAEEAIKAFDRGLEICRELEDWYGVGQSLGNLALAHQDAHRPAQARALYLQAADSFTRANAPTEAAQARAQAELT
ncbi:tetratricopeptide repeat protein [Streptomyces sp. 11x1]|nr:tetratricopeptide repeat protein [Streptomyces sp. 11x1]WNZ08612.1 tetratricopeptide repeat protein [Streptomyces sp. 11x1]